VPLLLLHLPWWCHLRWCCLALLLGPLLCRHLTLHCWQKQVMQEAPSLLLLLSQHTGVGMPGGYPARAAAAAAASQAGVLLLVQLVRQA
jgi:hypothetical protein